MKKEKNDSFYLSGIWFCNKRLSFLSTIQISIWWILLPLLFVSFLLDLEIIASIEFNYLSGILATICVLSAWYIVGLFTYRICLIAYRAHCVKKLEDTGRYIMCDKR